VGICDLLYILPFVINNMSMKNKIFLLVTLMSVVVVTSGWAFGLGAQFNGNISTDKENPFIPGWALALSPKDTLHFTFSWDFAEGSNNVYGITADVWALNLGSSQSGSVGTMGFFIGPGLYASYTEVGEGTFSFGLRLPFGLNFRLPQNTFEIYVQAAPSWGLHFYPSLALNNYAVIPVSLGLRVWI
jgi:hypothetical protein